MAEDLKIVLETQYKELKGVKESLQSQGAFKTDPKKLQQINIAIEQLGTAIQNLDPKSASGLTSVRSSFNKLYDSLIKVGLETTKASERMQQLYKSLQTVQDKINTRQDIRSNKASRLDESGRLSANDNWARSKVAGSGIKYAKGQVAKNPETLRNNVKAADENGWQGTFASESDYKKAIKIAKEIEVEETKVKEDIRQLDEEIKELTKALKTVQENIKKEDSNGALSPEVQKLVSGQQGVQTAISGQQEANTKEDVAENTAKNAASVAEFNKQLDKQSTSLGKAFKQFSIYAIALRTVKKALSEATKTVKELDKYLTEQAMVTGKTRQQTYALLKDYQQMASDLGATTKEVAEVSTQFMRQGKTTKDALTLTRAAISAAKVAGISTAESVDYLTTAVNGFRLSAQDAMRVSDKFAALAASAAVSYEEVATALSKVAAQANLAGMSIDYTTALLTKGIETTREPAESIGTALKTIVARMREITDYGKTLEDGMDLNNVEAQLRYVDIALRDQNGELRSTEDVLNELGTKWDTLSSNQQAAVAKALAGTRQQSRLIAMMQDYDRVIELQQIAARSAGATSAQAAVYMEGMEAALNKINVAWEKIVSGVTDSDMIINFLSLVAGFLDKIGEFLSTDFGIVTLLTTVTILGLNIIGQKLTEQRIARENNAIQQKINLAKLKEAKTESDIALQNKKKIRDEKALRVTKLQNLLTTLQAKAVNSKLSEFDQKTLQSVQQQLPIAQKELEVAQQEYDLEAAKNKSLEDQIGLQQMQTDNAMSMTGALSGIVAILGTIIGLYKIMAVGIGLVIKLTNKEERAKMKAAIADKIKAAWGMAGSASAIPYAGWIIAAAILATILGIGIAVAAINYNQQQQSAENAADSINKLSNEIYKLTEKANAIKSITKQYDELDNKIIKTNADIKEMTELLDKAADKLDDEEKQAYEHLATNEQKRRYLENIQRSATSEANAKRKEQIKKVRKMSASQRAKLLDSNTTNADFLEAQSAIYAINNNTLYSYIDSLAKVDAGVEKFTESILANLSAQEAWAYANDESGTMIKRLVDTINNATTVTSSGEQTTFAAVINSDDYSLRERINAYDQLHASIQALGDPALLKSFEQTYQQWEHLKIFTSETLDYIERLGMSIDNINDFSAALQKLGYTSEESANKINALFGSLEQGGNLAQTILATFDDVLSQFERGTQEWVNAYNRILNAYQAATGVTLTNIGQGITSLQSRISKFYETASKWSTLSEQEKTEFMQENDAMFRGETGEALARAFETGNYNLIQQALGNNEGLKEAIRLQLQELETALQIAEARRAAGEENEFEIKYLKEQIALLEDYQNAESEIYRADLKLRLDQEKAQLDIYKEYLQKQKEALEESLNKRRDAYQKYFDAVNQQAEDEDYDKQATMLTTNLSKLASSTNATAMQQTKELEKKFEELEEERLKTLRERAQEAVLSNLDNEVSQINEKFDKLLEDEAQLLAAMKGEIAADPNNFIQTMLTSGIQGMTATGAEDYIKNNFATAFDSILPAGATDGIKVDTKEDGTLILNINGTEIPIGEAAQQDLYIAVMNALKQLGLK